jgi:hypothetical protein
MMTDSLLFRVFFFLLAPIVQSLFAYQYPDVRALLQNVLDDLVHVEDGIVVASDPFWLARHHHIVWIIFQKGHLRQPANCLTPIAAADGKHGLFDVYLKHKQAIPLSSLQK